MTPFQKKIKSLTRRKFLPITFNLPIINEEKSLEELVIELKTVDPTSDEHLKIRNNIIERHLRLGIHIASRYGAIYPNKVEDLVGVMGLALTRWVRKARYKLKDNKITPFLTTNIHSEITKFIEEDKCLYIPGRTIRQYVITGNAKLDKPFIRVNLSEGNRENDEVDLEKYSIIAESKDDEGNVIETKEILEKVTTNYIEKRVIELRAKGFSYKEIEPQIGYSITSIHLIIKNVEEKFNQLYKAE